MNEWDQNRLGGVKEICSAYISCGSCRLATDSLLQTALHNSGRVPLAELQDEVVHGEDGGEDFNLFTERGDGVLEVGEHASLADKRSETHHDVDLSETDVGACAENQPVFLPLPGLCAGQPSLRDELLRVLVDLWVMQGGIHGGDDHGALRNGVAVGDRVGLLGDIGNHDDGGSYTQGFTDNHVGVLHLVDQLRG